MTKADLVDAVAAEAGISKRQAARIVDVIFEGIGAALRRGERVALAPFGNFLVRSRQGRAGRNPKTGESIIIPARRVAAFVAGRALKDAVDAQRSE